MRMYLIYYKIQRKEHGLNLKKPEEIKKSEWEQI